MAPAGTLSHTTSDTCLIGITWDPPGPTTSRAGSWRPTAVRARLVATGLPQPVGETRPIGPRPQVAAAALALTAAPVL